MLISHIASELCRESTMRKFVFPRLRAQGKIDEAEHNSRMERLAAALQILDTLMEHGVATVEELPLRLTPHTHSNDLRPMTKCWGGSPAPAPEEELNTGTKSTSTLSIIKGGQQ